MGEQPELNPRQRYNRRESARARKAESGIGNLWDDVAFLIRWGTHDELWARLQQLRAEADWWCQRGPHLQSADVEAVDGLEAASDRLHELACEAEIVEARLSDRGYEFDVGSRRIKKMKESGERGPKTDLVSEWAARIFDLLTDKHGWEERNTREIREEIRQRLADKVHPSRLDTGRRSPIWSAVNSRLYPNRHY